MVNIPSGNRSSFSLVKWKFMLDSPYLFGNQCCNVMKKNPVHTYGKQTGRKPITAQMAAESSLRTQQWIKNGCNAFDNINPISNPMSFWTEQDVLQYIKKKNLPICSVYGDIVVDDEMNGQISLYDIGLSEEMPKLKTTGCERTGCMFCGYGCHLQKGEGRFERMKRTHPKQYEFIMKPLEEGGLNYKEIIDWLNEHGNLHIKY